jgi:ribonucleoside-diphosphate reductase alpha chain
LDEVLTVKRTAQIRDAEGRVIFEMKDVEVPADWSQLAVDIVVSKYFRKAGVPGSGHEVSVKQVVSRMTQALACAAVAQGILSRPAARIFEDELSYLLIHQMGAFNSPVWFNLGLYEAYGIRGSSGNFAWSSKLQKVEPAPYSYVRPQCSACFIQSVEDDLMSIFDLAKNEARLFKYGSGTGTNFSKIRGRQESLSGGGFSSGLISFLEVLDRAAGAIQSGGTTRRAAKMVCLELDHPEIVDFIQWKMREEKKVAALVAAGWSPDFNGEAYHTVGGQNANHSVRVTNEFMEAVARGQVWQTRARTTGEVLATYEARDLWRQVAEAAWACADPGVQFETTIQEWHTCTASGPIRASNPCSEFLFLDDSSCNLASLNLVKFLTAEGQFDLEAFRRACRVFILAQDILVDASSYPTEQIAQNSHDFRPLGLGYANLGAFLMLKALPYDSEVGRAWAASITALMGGEAYRMSAELAVYRGAFEGWRKNRRSMLKVMDQHREAADRLPREGVPTELVEAAQQSWVEAQKAGQKFGFRNAQVTVLAPTGTIGLLMDCDTTGIEPEFALVRFKRLTGGGYLAMVNQTLTRVLRDLKYSENNIEAMMNYLIKTQTLVGAPHLREEHRAIFDCAASGPEQRSIAPLGHLRMMAAVQPFLSGGISKTVNVPHATTVEEVQEIYEQAWKLGLKSIAIYRDGCKLSQPLSTQPATPKISQSQSPKALESSIQPLHRCPNCGEILLQEGACYPCFNCGSTSGCS